MSNPDTKTRILNEAQRLIHAYGYQGFSYKHIAERLGLRNAAIHYHFPNKADLGTAYVERLLTQFSGYRDHLNQKYANDPVLRLQRLTAIPLNYLSTPGMTCPLGMLEADIRFLPAPMLQATHALGQAMRAWLAEILEQGRALGVMQFHGDAKTKALASWAMLQGASLMAASHDVELYEQVVNQLFTDLRIDNAARETL